VADERAFEAFVVARSQALLRSAFLLTRDAAAAEDLLQTALARSWSAWARIDDDPEPYVRRVLVNTYTSWWRRKWRGEVPTEVLPDREAGTAGAARPAAAGSGTSIEDRLVLWQALGRLTRKQRAVVVLRYLEDLTEAETARILGVSVGTVKSQTSKALAALRVDPLWAPDAALSGGQNHGK
jgi:RNA polymerase sigma-70 factor (sigma-E family)